MRFLLPFLASFLATLATVIWTHGRYNALRPADWAAATITLLLVPLVSAWLALILVQLRKPRRWLQRGAAGRKRAAAIAFLAGSLSIASTGVCLYYANRPWPGSEESQFNPGLDTRRIPDALVIGLNAFAFATLAIWLMPTRRPGLCAACGYDIRFSLDANRCPECGRPLLA